MKHRKTPKTQALLDQFKGEDPAAFIASLTPKKIGIIELLNEGYYGAAIARHLDISRSYVSKFISELKSRGFIEVEWVNPLLRKATSYRVAPELKNYLLHIQKPKGSLTLSTPHNIRFKFPIIGKKKPISTTTKRFAASKLKLTKEWCMRGGVRYIFEMKHENIGRVGLICHPNSLVVYQCDRSPVIAKSVSEATNIVSMALSDVAQRFIQEQSWENVHMDLGSPTLVGSPHYSFPSKIAKRVVEAGQSLIKVGNEHEIDNSLEKKGILDQSEIETVSIEEADLVDRGLRVAADIENILPNLVKQELKSISEQITGMNQQSEKIDMLCNNVAALTQSGLPLQNLYNQLSGVVARQQEQITQMQTVTLKIVENMSKIIDKIENKKIGTLRKM